MSADTAAPASARILDWDGLHNVRDLGGLGTADGRAIRHGALVRSDLLCRLADRARRAPIDHGIRTIVDVRFTDEVAHDWHLYPFRDWASDLTLDGLRYVNVPFDGGRPPLPEADQARIERARSRAEINRLDLDLSRPGICAIVAAIADAQAGGVLVHCHGGKDRTGISVAVVLSFLGVPDDAIADDYALSGLNLEPLLIEWLDSMSDDPAERDRLRRLATPSREAMLETLDHLARVYGSARDYLRAGGLTDAQLARLRARLLE